MDAPERSIGCYDDFGQSCRRVTLREVARTGTQRLLSLRASASCQVRRPRTSTPAMLQIRLGCDRDKYTTPAVVKGVCIMTGEDVQYFNACDVAITL